MSLTSEIADMEAQLKVAGVSIDAVLAKAGIDRSTWTRWKNGTVRYARYDSIQRVKAAASEAVSSNGAAA